MDAHLTAIISPKGKYIPPGGFQVPGRLVHAREGTKISYPRRLQWRTRTVIGPFFIPFVEQEHKPSKPSSSHSKLIISHKFVWVSSLNERRVKHTIQKHSGAKTTYTYTKRLHLIIPPSVVRTNTHEIMPPTWTEKPTTRPRHSTWRNRREKQSILEYKPAISISFLPTIYHKTPFHFSHLTTIENTIKGRLGRSTAGKKN